MAERNDDSLEKAVISDPMAFHTMHTQKEIEATDFSDEKKATLTTEVLDAEYEEEEQEVKRAEELNARIQNDEATTEEYRVLSAHDVAIKVLSTRDDTELKVNTFRMWFLGLGFAAFGSVLAQLYYFKPQGISVSVTFLLIISYFFGKAWEKALPSRGWFRFLNPGPFNIKEHGCVIIMASTASGTATAINVIAVQQLYYTSAISGAIAVFTLFGSQLMGYGFAGLLCDALVFPAITFWPSQISNAAVFQALHFDGGLSTKRLKIFWGVFLAIFCWEIIPQYAFPLVGGFSLACLINHTSPTVRNVFGGGSNNEGMGFLSWSFDWNYVGVGALYTPLWTQINENIGICFTYVLMAAAYYGNIWNGQNFPFMSQAIFASDGTQYNQSLILNAENKFDEAAYEAQGPAWFAATNVVALITSNLALSAVSVHTLLFYWQDIKPFFLSFMPWRKQTTRMYHNEHYHKMLHYKQIPKWWFYVVLAIAFAMAQATNYTGNSHLPWWALIVCLILALLLTSLYATTNALIGFTYFESGLNGLFQLICAYMVPGDPVANMYAALYGGTPTGQTMSLLADLKLGQYLKIPPRMNFAVQIVGCMVGALLNWVMMNSIVNAQRPALLSIAGTRLWSGQQPQGYNSTAIAWGALAPKMFCYQCTYRMVPLALLVGAFLPVPGYIAYRLRPTWGIQNFNTGVIIQYSCYLSVGLNCSVNTTMALGIFSQFYLRRYRPRAFTKYNYIVAGAIGGGTQVMVFLLDFAVDGAGGAAHAFPQWWGNDGNYSADRCLSPA